MDNPNKQPNGFLLINKPPAFAKASAGKSGPTSHDVIDQLRKITGIKQIGHAGTLDPFASGLLLVGIGEATKLLRHYVGLDKKYEAILRLDATSDTYDRTGKVSRFKIKDSRLKKKNIEEALKTFIGKQKQVPPMYSAKKVGGKKLYELARQGQDIKREAIDIEVYDIKLLSCNSKLATCNFHVSSGTYIRALAHDIGQRLGCGAYLEELKRTAIGDFKLKDAISLRHLERSPATRGGVERYNKSNTLYPSASRVRSARDDVFHHLIPLKTVLVSGTFDGVHEGHRNYFQQARQYGQRLIAIVGRDKIVAQIKGREPKYSEKERLRFVKQCPEIDRVYLGVLDNIFDFTASLTPDVIALGYDQTAYTKNLAAEMKKRGLAVKIVRLKPYLPEKYKSSLINKAELT